MNPLPVQSGSQIIVYTYDSIASPLCLPGSPRPPHAPTRDNVGHEFCYDANGNQISIATSSSTIDMQYNHINKLERVVRNGAVEFKYIYDGNGNRIAKTVSGQVVERYFGSVEIKNGQRNRYYFFNSRRIAERNVDSGTLAFYHPDHLGSTSVVTDAHGAEIHRADYYEFGALRSETGPKAEDFAYNDKRRDKETDFYDYGARAYAAKFFKFTSPDSIVPNPGDPQHLNRYAYVNNNPMKYTDPSGHFAVGLANSLYQMASSQSQSRSNLFDGARGTIQGENGTTLDWVRISGEPENKIKGYEHLDTNDYALSINAFPATDSHKNCIGFDCNWLATETAWSAMSDWNLDVKYLWGQNATGDNVKQELKNPSLRGVMNHSHGSPGAIYMYDPSKADESFSGTSLSANTMARALNRKLDFFFSESCFAGNQSGVYGSLPDLANVFVGVKAPNMGGGPDSSGRNPSLMLQAFRGHQSFNEWSPDYVNFFLIPTHFQYPEHLATVRTFLGKMGTPAELNEFEAAHSLAVASYWLSMVRMP